jgi:hypothetical protein
MVLVYLKYIWKLVYFHVMEYLNIVLKIILLFHIYISNRYKVLY